MSAITKGTFTYCAFDACICSRQLRFCRDMTFSNFLLITIACHTHTHAHPMQLIVWMNLNIILQEALNLPKTRSGKIMRRVLRKIARDETDFGDISTLADPSVVELLQDGRKELFAPKKWSIPPPTMTDLSCQGLKREHLYSGNECSKPSSKSDLY